ncbi:Lactation elevated protein 1 [Thelohanellus kitauei]|uniref:Lactation elevated protein 1 n=1 Tax=Thelohanellus kitauei TaxID=669202 RepID=A0A0C2IRC9_THEKT|nr:Lactation elevated protein 1 [Thelohanellus kitauei]
MSNMCAADYRAICENFPVVFLRNLPKMYPRQNSDLVRRFISFIDAVYDCRAHLFVLAEHGIDELFYLEDINESDYISDEIFAISRTVSRLHEITGSAYSRKLHFYSQMSSQEVT